MSKAVEAALSAWNATEEVDDRDGMADAIRAFLDAAEEDEEIVRVVARSFQTNVRIDATGLAPAVASALLVVEPQAARAAILSLKNALEG